MSSALAHTVPHYNPQCSTPGIRLSADHSLPALVFYLSHNHCLKMSRRTTVERGGGGRKELISFFISGARRFIPLEWPH